MNEAQAKELIDKIVGQVFGLQNPYSLEDFATKFAFDIRLTSEVTDSTTGESTWVQSTQGNKFIKFSNLTGNIEDSMMEPRPLQSIEDILRYWQEASYSSTERYLDSINVSKSDAIYGSQNVYRSIDVSGSKNIAFCDTVQNSEFVAASQRSQGNVYSLRIDDSGNVSNSFQITWSKNISNCLFIKDSSDLADCMFCSQIEGKRFCIANMQYTEEEYRKWEKLVKAWVLTN
jgi:hypothetical protein